MPLSERSIPLIGVVTPFLAIAFLAVGVRLYVRVTSLKNSGWDDWLCLGAVVSHLQSEHFAPLIGYAECFV